MKNQLFSAENLSRLRDGLPHGVQTKIAKRHNIEPRCVSEILHGKLAGTKKCNYLDVINDAIKAYEDANEGRRKTKEALEAIINE